MSRTNRPSLPGRRGAGESEDDLSARSEQEGEEGGRLPVPMRRRVRPELLDSLEESGALVLRNIVLFGRRTSIRLELEMWRGLDEICRREAVGLADLCEQLAATPRHSNLTAAIRVFILLYFRGPEPHDGGRP